MIAPNNTAFAIFLFIVGILHPWTLLLDVVGDENNDGVLFPIPIPIPIPIPMTILLGGPIISFFLMLVLQYILLILPPCLKAKAKVKKREEEDHTPSISSSEDEKNKTNTLVTTNDTNKRLATIVSILLGITLYSWYIVQVLDFVRGSSIFIAAKLAILQLLYFGGAIYLGFVQGKLQAFIIAEGQEKERKIE